MYNYFEVVVKSEKEFFGTDFLEKVFGEDKDGLEIKSKYKGMVKSLCFCFEMDMDELTDLIDEAVNKSKKGEGINFENILDLHILD